VENYRKLKNTAYFVLLFALHSLVSQTWISKQEQLLDIIMRHYFIIRNVQETPNMGPYNRVPPRRLKINPLEDIQEKFIPPNNEYAGLEETVSEQI